jgi:predicted polyphosphate/ATP-dependent NAD kinase
MDIKNQPDLKNRFIQNIFINSPIGVYIVQDGKLLLADADEQALLRFLGQHHNGKAEIIVTAIGGQGHILGRGNQQLSPAVLRKVGLDNITVTATKSKIADLQGRPLLVDSNDPDLDAELIGFRAVITGYDDQILYRIDSPTG